MSDHDPSSPSAYPDPDWLEPLTTNPVEAVRRVAWWAGASPDSSEAPDCVRRVAIAACADSHRWWSQRGIQLLQALNDGFPTPVLHVSGAGSSEVCWTKYLSYLMDGSQPHGLGSHVATAVWTLVSGGAPPGRPLTVLAEQHLGEAVCDREDCRVGRRGCQIDIILHDGSQALAIEHKIRSGLSDREMKCGHVSSQLDAYDQVLPRWCSDRGLTLVAKGFLAPDKQKHGDWVPFSHDDIAIAVAPTLNDIEPPAPRELLRSFVCDLGSVDLGAVYGAYLRLRATVLADANPSVIFRARQELEKCPTLSLLLLGELTQ